MGQLNSGKQESPCLKNKVEKQSPRLSSDLWHTDLTHKRVSYSHTQKQLSVLMN